MEQGFPILPMGKVWSAWTSWVYGIGKHTHKSRVSPTQALGFRVLGLNIRFGRKHTLDLPQPEPAVSWQIKV